MWGGVGIFVLWGYGFGIFFVWVDGNDYLVVYVVVKWVVFCVCSGFGLMIIEYVMYCVGGYFSFDDFLVYRGSVEGVVWLFGDLIECLK